MTILLDSDAEPKNDQPELGKFDIMNIIVFHNLFCTTKENLKFKHVSSLTPFQPPKTKRPEEEEEAEEEAEEEEEEAA